ncbi:hypothetical protein NUK49_21760, partial [Aeromonas caviae]
MIDNSNNFPVRVTIPGYQVIASGIVHLSSTEVKFELANLVIKYKFISDSSGVRFDAAVINNELIINLYNFNNGLGEGKLEPTEIGTLGDKKLFLITHDPQPASRADMASEGLPRLHAP